MIKHLPGTILTPEVVLHRTLDKLPRVKAVMVVIQWDDDTFDMDWSSMRVSEMFMAVAVAHRNVDQTAFETANQ